MCKETNFYFLGSRTTAPVVKGDILSAEKKNICVWQFYVILLKRKSWGGGGYWLFSLPMSLAEDFNDIIGLCFIVLVYFFYRWVRMKKCRLFHSLFHCCQNFEMIYYLLFISNLEKRNISLFAPGNYECLCNEQVVQHIILI